MAGHVQHGQVSSECKNCRGSGVVPDDDEQLVAFAAACGAMPGDDCPNCHGYGVMTNKDDLDPATLEALAAGMTDDLGDYLTDEDDCR